ncbi:MAG TPA: glycosyltransferase family 39 protein [Vicinamibacteria bacterium]|nr:glycosyltransferase family 39 protein [Vicinamibacteria bacterium]
MSAPPGWRAALAAAALALSVRAGLFVAASRVHPDSFMTPDSYGYDALARTLLHDARFAASPVGPPQTRRTPGFPLLIAAIYAVAGEDPRAVVLVGIGISVLTVWLTAWVAGRLWGARAALIAGVLLALDIPSATASRRLLTETPFAALVLAATAAAVGLLVEGRPRAWRGFLMGTLLAAAALTRPIGLFLVIPAALWLVLCGRTLRWSPRSTAWLLAALALPWILMVGGWQVRNRVAAGALVASDGPAKFVYLSRGSDILAQRDGISVEVARAQLLQSIDDEVKRTGRPAERLYARAALALVARHPILFLKTQVRWLPELLLGTGAAGLSLAFDLGDGPDRPRAWWWALSAGAALHLLVLYAGAACGLWRMRAEAVPVRLLAVLLAGLVAYFVLLSAGPQAYSRFRVPFTPLLALAAARGLERRSRPQAGVSDPSSSQCASSRRVR